MTVYQIIYDLRELLKKYSDDSDLSDRYIIYTINKKRSKLIKFELDKFGRKFSNSVLQTLCMPVEMTDANECGITCSQKIARTVNPIPGVLQLVTRDAISRVGPTDTMAKPFTIIDRNRASFADNSIFNNNIKTFLHDNGHLYFISNKVVHLTNVLITGIFDNPLEISEYNNQGVSCYDVYTDDYPIDPHMMDQLINETVNQLALKEKIREDKENDAETE